MIMVVCSLDLRYEWERCSSIKANSLKSTWNSWYILKILDISKSVLHHGCNWIASYLHRTSFGKLSPEVYSVYRIYPCCDQVPRNWNTDWSYAWYRYCAYVFLPMATHMATGNPTAKSIGPRRCNSPMPLRPSPASSYGRAPELTELTEYEPNKDGCWGPKYRICRKVERERERDRL